MGPGTLPPRVRNFLLDAGWKFCDLIKWKVEGCVFQFNLYAVLVAAFFNNFPAFLGSWLKLDLNLEAIFRPNFDAFFLITVDFHLFASSKISVTD